MRTGKTLYFDCVMGAAGDMLLGALFALAPAQDAFLQAFAALELPGVALTVQPVTQVAGGDIFALPPGKRAVVDGECHLDRRIGDLDERQRLRFPGGADRAADGQI